MRGRRSKNHNAEQPIHDLFRHVCRGDVDRVKALLESGACKGAKHSPLTEALNIAAKKGHAEIIKLLFNAGAKIDSDVNGYTPLHGAAGRGQLNAVYTLCSLGANLAAKDDTGNTALHYAASFGQVLVVNALLDLGTDKDDRDNYDETPLMVAARAGSMPVVMTLLRAGVELSAKNIVNQTAQSVARNPEIGKVIAAEARQRELRFPTFMLWKSYTASALEQAETNRHIR